MMAKRVSLVSIIYIYISINIIVISFRCLFEEFNHICKGAVASSIER